MYQGIMGLTLVVVYTAIWAWFDEVVIYDVRLQ